MQEVRICVRPDCQEEFVPYCQYGPPQVYCSQRCGIIMRGRRRRKKCESRKCGRDGCEVEFVPRWRGRRTYCSDRCYKISRKRKECIAQWKRNYPEKVNEANRRSWEKNKQEIIERRRLQRQMNPEEHRRRCKSYEEKRDLEKRNEQSRSRYAKNPEKFGEFTRRCKARRKQREQLILGLGEPIQ